MRRIYAFAKELGLDNKQLLDICDRCGIVGKGSALASLDEEEVSDINRFLSEGESVLAEIVSKYQSRNAERERARKIADGHVANLLNAVTADVTSGFNHFVVIELGAIFEMMLKLLCCNSQGTLGETITIAAQNGVIDASMEGSLREATLTRNALVHRKAGHFPDEDDVAEARHCYANGILSICRNNGQNLEAFVPLADSNPRVLRMLEHDSLLST